MDVGPSRSLRGVRSGARAALVALAIMASSATAAAADPEAEKLFADGSALMGTGAYADALAKLVQAQRLDPGIGTQFNIAVCHEKLGHLATAWRNFEEVARLARASGKKAREDAARAKLEELRPRLSSFVIRSEEPGDVLVKIDGTIVNKESWAFIPVDPGEHVVQATAPTKKPWSASFAAPLAGEKRDIVVPVLNIVQETKLVTVTKETSNGRRTVGFVLGGVGVAGVVAATVTGLMLLDAKSTADERCKPKCVNEAGEFDQTGSDAVNRGETLLPVNAIAWGVAVVGLGVGTFLILTSSKSASAEPTKAARATPLFDGRRLTLAF